MYLKIPQVACLGYKSNDIDNTNHNIESGITISVSSDINNNSKNKGT